MKSSIFNVIPSAILLALLSLLTTSSAFSAEVGDTISEDLQQQLNIPKGQVGVVDFFASWCLSCAKEIPDIKKMIKQDNQKKMHVIGIDVDEELDEGIAFQKELSIDFPVINDVNQTIISEFSPIAMPALYYIIDNKIVGKHIGAVPNIDEKIKNDLQKFGVNI